MTSDPAEDVLDAIRALYGQNPHAQEFFDLNAQRERDANATSLDVISRKLNISRGDAVALARQLEDTGCGHFRVGRRGAKSRFEWAYSCVGLGKAAAGEPIQLESAENPQEEEEEEEEVETVGKGMTIAEAKSALAARLGISVSQIEIIIKA
jgi:biotin operon repressor